MKKILVVYYTQSGQLKELVDGIVNPLENSDDYQIDYFKIEPIKDFPFPWSNTEFYDCMPESVEGSTIPIKPFNMDGDYDLVILAYQVWFLNLSIPFWSILQDAKMKEFLKNKKVITILGIRNMWVNAQKRLLAYFNENEVNHVGNLVFSDPNPNLVSVLTVLKHLTTGKKKPIKFLPPYGVSKNDISRLPSFGKLIIDAFKGDTWTTLQNQFVDNKGVAIDFSLRTTELAAGRIFKLWSSFVLKKGEAGNPARKGRLKIYEFYLLFLIFFISPFSSLIFKIVYILLYPITKKSLLKTALQLH
ncbi:MAG: hypothetical protein KAG64_09090 [Bacteroidales bacterium]|nr:hypothetical protein [Bacteroidales bacterium]